MEIEVNYLAVLAAAAASMIVGFLWYGPALFGGPWARLKGYTEESLQEAQKGMGKLYAVSFVTTLITAFVLSHVMTVSSAFYELPDMPTGLASAFWVWLGFVMPVQVTASIFGEKKLALLGIDTGYQLVSLLAMGAVLAAF